MFKKIKIPNLKLVRVLVFALIIIGGGLTYVHPASATSINISPASSSYTVSETNVSLNNDGAYTTVILVGCLPQSGDKYDMNTGKLCNYDTNATVLIGCAPRSGDKYDMNTGNPCVSDNKTVFLIACAPSSGDTHNIYSGIPCAKSTVYKEPNNDTTSSTTKVKPLTTGINKNINPYAVSTEQSVNLSKTSSEGGASGREIIKNGLFASVAKVGSIFKGPMSTWIILLLIVIILAGGYGAYSFNLFKSNNEDVKDEVKETVAPLAPKANTVSPTASAPVTPTTTQGTIPLGSTTATSQSTNNIPHSQSQSQTIH